ncbi:hypothetical protein G7Y89_g11825 [Cudoniella acicularis]|uniref:RlpA-like protein double-psi beta-barrel domain-containing protein n=1 Tax=Cudoniella acicularis TaxID=354080 RepID=A0A8H4RCK5_9HELO|nr:hypothetical protein G7Y89_g11825 [Cudoniella acicularis]
MPSFRIVLATVAFFLASLCSAVKVGKEYSGTATVFDQMGGAGSCGEYHQDSDYVVAVSNSWGHNAYCGSALSITIGSTTISAVVADMCPACDSTHLDLSRGAFLGLTGMIESPAGHVDITWRISGAKSITAANISTDGSAPAASATSQIAAAGGESTTTSQSTTVAAAPTVTVASVAIAAVAAVNVGLEITISVSPTSTPAILAFGGESATVPLTLMTRVSPTPSPYPASDACVAVY